MCPVYPMSSYDPSLSHTSHDFRTREFTNSEGVEWQTDALEGVLLKVTLVKNAAGHGMFRLPEKLRKMHAVVSVDCGRAFQVCCTKYEHLILAVCPLTMIIYNYISYKFILQS